MFLLYLQGGCLCICQGRKRKLCMNMYDINSRKVNQSATETSSRRWYNRGRRSLHLLLLLLLMLYVSFPHPPLEGIVRRQVHGREGHQPRDARQGPRKEGERTVVGHGGGDTVQKGRTRKQVRIRHHFCLDGVTWIGQGGRQGSRDHGRENLVRSGRRRGCR